MPPLCRSGRAIAAGAARAQTPANLAASDAICTGLQLTNFWQDIAIDWQKNRVYLPQDDLRRFGARATLRKRADDAWRAPLAFEVARARLLLELASVDARVAVAPRA